MLVRDAAVGSAGRSPAPLPRHDRDRRSFPQFLNAQQPAPAPAAPASDSAKTHTVKRGDTLWDIAKSYLGDPFLWPEIYRLNTDTIEDPHWIFPGQQLKLPGDHAKIVAVAVAVPETPADSSAIPPAAAEIPAKLPMDTAVAAIPVEPIALMPTVVRDTATPLLQARATTVLPGEYVAAPWVDRDGGPRNPGLLIESADLPGIASHRRAACTCTTASSSRRRRAPCRRNTRSISRIASDRTIEDFGQIVIPTGVIEVTPSRATRRGGDRPGREDVRRSDAGSEVDHAYDSSAANVVGHPAAITNGRTGHVRWIYDEPVLPSLQSYVVIDISRRDGLTTGDQIELFKPRQRPNDATTSRFRSSRSRRRRCFASRPTAPRRSSPRRSNRTSRTASGARRRKDAVKRGGARARRTKMP